MMGGFCWKAECLSCEILVEYPWGDEERVLACQATVVAGMRIREIPIVTRYFNEASQINFFRSCVYGLSILAVMLRYKLQKWGYRNDPVFR